MSRSLLPLAALLAAAALAGCGGKGDGEWPEAPAEAATVAHRDQRPSASPEQHSAGWAAPAPVPGADAGELSEDFRSGSRLRRWGYFEGDYGRNRLLVRGGRLEVSPSRSRWSGDDRAFYLFREVRGDFDVRARVRVGGDARSALAGLMVRARLSSYGDGERWVSLSTGFSDARRVVDRTSTADSRSGAATVPGARGWTDLRIARAGTRLRTWWRPAGGRWEPCGTLARGDLPDVVQVGVAASGDGGGARAQVDWVRFARP